MSFKNDIREQFIRILGKGWVKDDQVTLYTYRCDGLTLYTAPPMGVLFPGTVHELVSVIKLLNQHKISFIARGAGTGLSGGAIPQEGYPQHTILSDEHLLASRLDFKYPLITAPLWGFVSAFKIQGTVFYDQGKIWSQGDSYEKAKLRKNAGMGIEWTIDTASLIQVPLKFEVAFPMD